MPTDVFLSYSRHDKDTAGQLAKKLEAHGLTVWWDRIIPPGKEFDQVIEEELDDARCVVVLWSETSVASRWVKTEAQEGARRKVLIPVQITPVRIPLEFRRLQAADLTGWKGNEDDPEYRKVVTAILGQLDQAAEPTPEIPKVREPKTPNFLFVRFLRLRSFIEQWGRRRLVIAHGVGGSVICLSYRLSGLDPDNSLSVLYFVLLPYLAMAVFYETPFRVAAAAWLNASVAVFVLTVGRPDVASQNSWGVLALFTWFYVFFAIVVSSTRTISRKRSAR